MKNNICNLGKGKGEGKILDGKLLRISLGLAIFTASPYWSHAAGTARQPKIVHFKTQDDWTLRAAYDPPIPKGPAVVLLHGLGSANGEWGQLAQRLSERGMATLAVDLRGHSGSRRHGKAGDWRTFLDMTSTGEWARMWQDAAGAVRFLESRGHQNIGIVGASIGANLGLEAAAKNKNIRFVVLLSPGLEYQTIKTDSAMVSYGARPLLLAASPKDGYAFQSCQVLRQLRSIGRLPADWLQAPEGHGVQMFSDLDILRQVTDWIVRRAQNNLPNASR